MSANKFQDRERQREKSQFILTRHANTVEHGVGVVVVVVVVVVAAAAAAAVVIAVAVLVIVFLQPSS